MTKAQQQWLDSLICQRISFDERNETLRMGFENEKVQSLIDFIEDPDVISVDSNGDIAVYVIKDDRQLLAFFTIQCGLVFEKIITDEEMEFYNLFTKRQNGNIKGEEATRLINFQATHDLSEKDMTDLFDKIEQTLTHVRPKKNDDAKFEEATDVSLVNKTMPGIEIVHFCKNDQYDGQFHELFPDAKMGEVLFMKKIVPILKQVRSLIGCKYVYLFAVTNERDDKLVTHYRKFGFKSNPGFGVSKALHASGCVFMAQPLPDLFEYAKTFSVDTKPLTD